MFGGLKLAPLLTEIKVDIKSFKDDMEAAKAVGTAKAEEISKALSGTTKAGEQLAKVGRCAYKRTDSAYCWCRYGSGKAGYGF